MIAATRVFALYAHQRRCATGSNDDRDDVGINLEQVEVAGHLAQFLTLAGNLLGDVDRHVALGDPARTADELLRERLMARLEAEKSWRTGETNVLVCNGEVTLQGLFDRAADRAASVAIARAMPGVRAVDDRRVRAREWQAMA